MNSPFHIATFPDYNSLSKAAADYAYQQLSHLAIQQSFVLGLPTGSTPVGMYKHLINLLTINHPAIQPSNLTTFNLDEYYPIKHDDPQSYHYFMTKNLWQPYNHLAIQPFNNSQFNIPNGESADPENECQIYEELIKKHGPIDLMILGIGTNGHIGFNEPGSQPTSRTRVVTLSEETITANSRFFSSKADVPKRAITMGLGTILESKEILVLASGESKRPILQKLQSLSAPTPDIPASWLMNHSKVTFYIDSSARPRESFRASVCDENLSLIP